MSVKLQNLVLESATTADLDAVTLSVLRAIAWRAYDDGWCSMPFAQIQRETALGESAIRRAIRRLTDAGLLLAESRQGSGKTPRFRVLETAFTGEVERRPRPPKKDIRQTFTSVPGTEVEEDRLLFTSVPRTATSVRGTEVGPRNDQYVQTRRLRSLRSTAQQPCGRSLASFDTRGTTWLKFLHDLTDADVDTGEGALYDPHRAPGDRYNRGGLETALRDLAARDGFTGGLINRSIAAKVAQFITVRTRRDDQDDQDRRRDLARAARNGFREADPSMRSTLAYLAQQRGRAHA